MAAPEATHSANQQAQRNLVPICLLAVGCLARLLQAKSPPAPPYQAPLTPAPPPLLIVLLHYWSALGTSEWILRLPSVIAGTAFCWMVFLWLERVTDRTTALIALSLLLFSPALIYLSAEIRQYALLQFFAACSLYFLERGVGERSPRLMLWSALSLYLALLSHYSALL